MPDTGDPETLVPINTMYWQLTQCIGNQHKTYEKAPVKGIREQLHIVSLHIAGYLFIIK